MSHANFEKINDNVTVTKKCIICMSPIDFKKGTCCTSISISDKPLSYCSDPMSLCRVFEKLRVIFLLYL